ncbi:MAG TPA: type II toxin-antitoxin system VapC family toxin [Candidatus Thermoplasmatota archaeon]|nr:type II toxin-antitoxin system VapC family toxin [Candidatus Thermoplasmatota archaeon]
MIDSWAWIEYFKGSRPGQKARTYIDGEEDAIISAINAAEVYRWVLREYDEPTAEEYRGVLKARARLMPVDEPLAILAAQARAAHGWGLGDAIVYATARLHDARILTGDPDFRKVQDVIFIG